ncbi:ubiquinone-dependent pyruvate dehydrogenase [Streptomyces sp. NPDC056909]|uniref:ubiquinone-dependent pyruvate dehydrogenase n=1 Tax=Streptomyces sp. NPDC056909 TaxID=3345963 RepID=UPI0036BDB61B
MAFTVADAMVSTLKASGVRRIYGLPGDSLNGFTDALRRDGDIAWKHVRHEEAAAFAAAAEAGVTGKLAVAASSCGPGNLHLINGMFDAQRSRVPVLVIAAHIPRVEIGGGYFQETHPQELFRECSVYCEMASVPEQVPRLMEMAMRTALERDGVGVVVIPGELFLDRAAASPRPRPVFKSASLIRPDDSSLAQAAHILNTAERVTILGGAGCAGAHDEAVALAAALKAPMVHSLRGKDFLEYDNPYDVGLTGLIGYSSGYRAMEHCDALLMLGTDFPYRSFYPENVPVVQVDVRGEQIGRRTPVDVPLVGTVKDTAQALLPLLERRTDDGFAEKVTGHYRRVRAHLDQLAEAKPTDSPMHPQYVAATINRLAARDAVFTADVGTPTVWAARYLRMNGERRLIGSFNHGSMANALPHAIGVQASHPGRQVVALSGDGGLAMLLGELITLRQLDLPVKIVVFDNSALSFVELEMTAAGITTYGTDLRNPDFSAQARAAGLFGARVERADELEDVLRAAFTHDGPALIDARTERHELSLPPKITLEQLKGFTLFATRTVLSGRGDEILELAKTNLRQLSVE